ncbi:mercuric transporter MerT family protein [Sphingomonas sp. BE138]|uniref:mercuric transporter MerT family protein n=1 Tax=Sphingomonas sp. BE138 TaxID=2817845 RepID=UPI00286AFE09|nr:mercuric transporter MerT family protein [Sphingomonas sp. BE138]
MNPNTRSLEIPDSPATPRRADAALSAIGALASFGAVFAAASCCVLPLALAALGMGAGLSSTFATLMPLRWPLTALSLIGLAAGWWAYARRRRACAADRSCTVPLPSRATPIMLAIGSALTLIALIWDRLEAPLMKAIS